MGLSGPQTPSYPGSSSVASNGTTLHRASRCRMASSRASTAACATSASMSTCTQPSPRRATSSKNGGTTTTPTDRTRASTGSHQPSSQLAPRRGKTGTDSPYDRGQIGEQVSRPQWLVEAHRDLDSAVAAAYGCSADISEDDALAGILE